MEYERLAELYQKLESTTKRLEKTKILADFLKSTDAKHIDKVMLLVEGLVFPKYDDRKIGIASKLVVKALYTATGIPVEEIEKSWKKTGDLGETAEQLVQKKRQHTLFSQELTVTKVFSNVQKLATIEGHGSVDVKMKTIAELLTSAKPLEAKYITRLLLEDLRVGLGEGTIRDAIAWAYLEEQNGKDIDVSSADALFGKDSELSQMRNQIQEAYDLTNDYAEVARIVKEKGIEGLEQLRMNPLHPVKVMLAQKVKDTAEGFETVGKPCAVEYKYDGFRMLIGKHGGEIVIHTRRLENVTAQFPEVVELVRTHVKGGSFIIDCEAVGFDPKTGKYVPFQNISQRIKRKYDIEKLAKEVPVELNVFDILYYDEKSLIKEPYRKRRALIESIIVPQKQAIRLSEQKIVENEAEVESFYKESLAAGNEGIMFKTLDAPYKPGSRVGFMVKMKPIMETLDVVIVGGEWGEGKRSGWISSFVVAVFDPSTDEFVEIGKFGTGVKEKEEEGTSFGQITELLKPLIIKESGREIAIRPGLVVELSFEEIQKSTAYSSGYALRFPRLVRIREDRAPDDCSTLDQVEQMFRKQ